MSGSIVFRAYNPLAYDLDFPLKPEKLHHCGRAFGLLSAIQLDDECNCIIATIGKRRVVLPNDMQVRLEPFLDRHIGLAMFYDEFSLRELEHPNGLKYNG